MEPEARAPEVTFGLSPVSPDRRGGRRSFHLRESFRIPAIHDDLFSSSSAATVSLSLSLFLFFRLVASSTFTSEVCLRCVRGHNSDWDIDLTMMKADNSRAVSFQLSLVRVNSPTVDKKIIFLTTRTRLSSAISIMV